MERGRCFSVSVFRCFGGLPILHTRLPLVLHLAPQAAKEAYNVPRNGPESSEKVETSNQMIDAERITATTDVEPSAYHSLSAQGVAKRSVFVAFSTGYGLRHCTSA